MKPITGTTLFSVTPPSGLTFKDVRQAVAEIGSPPAKLSVVQVSDDWWVMLENGEPVGKLNRPGLTRLMNDMTKMPDGYIWT